MLMPMLEIIEGYEASYSLKTPFASSPMQVTYDMRLSAGDDNERDIY